jgi:hypothetical protein
MKTKLGNKRAISVVLTTVIILVSSVVLGSGVVLYGSSLFQGSTQTEAITTSGTKVFVHTTADDGLAWGAAGVRNTGDKVISVDKIQIRGTDIPYSNWYPDTEVSATLFQTAYVHPGWSNVEGMLEQSAGATCTSEELQIDLGASDSICADAATGPVSLAPGQSAIIYFKLVNGTLTPLDSGVSTSVNIFAGKAGAPQSITVQGKS